MSQREKAKEKFTCGYNCAQSVLCAYAEELGIDESAAYRLSEGFGGGMGMKDVCGAVSGMIMVAGMKSDASLDKVGQTKQDTYANVQELCKQFKAKNGSLKCAKLVNDRAKEDPAYKKQLCSGYIDCACELLETLEK
ncbi:MAG: C-GCAxxG-C-C family protein [Bacillota bacterium]|nr:C-GCAxxG-C-C family protein [Bacillota bacterium]